MSKQFPFTFVFGGLAKPLREQLNDIGVRLDDEKVRHFELDADAVFRLVVRGVITPAERERAYRRLTKLIGEEIKRAQKEE